ncbi:leucine-rich repeat-containing protein, putative [Ricinus communis]|uniref:Leucine-rich repeat-containing protein, putative n=1 Tax=Ricinus communis TaxID=3988 RepID=B9S2G2_RICCO|nr:leucine-rich repeat-containing protein, putative [Ricinus communis]
MKLLNVRSNRVQVLGLYGMGGIGKTTLAKAFYNKLINHFVLRCFISNVREIADKDGGLISLQNILLGDLFPSEQPVYDVDAGSIALKRKLHEKRVLAVLDDVDDVSQLNALAGSRDWFGEGSQIIITTRNKDVLIGQVVNELYEVQELFASEALQLFSYLALRREKPTDDYLNLSKQIVSLTGALPLALEVFGSFLLHKRTVKQREDALKKLQQIRPHNLQDVLRISFDGLDEEVKCAFLDVACLFVNSEIKKEEAIDILMGCGFRAHTVMNVLTAKSLIKIREDCTLWMHDQLRDMGRQIVQLEDLVDPGRRSRLWDHNEIVTGTKEVQGIILDFRKKRHVEDLSADTILLNNFLTTPNLTSALAYVKEKFKMYLLFLCGLQRAAEVEEPKLGTEVFESMVNMRLLQINYAKLEGKFKYFPAGLKWLQWKGCALKFLPSDYSPWQLAVPDLSESGIERLWGCTGNKVAESLRVINLHGCYILLTTPDLSGYKSLEKLNLEPCIRLTKIDKSLGNLRECSNIVEFPRDVSGLKHLQILVLSDCTKLKELPEDIGNMNSLRELLADGTAIPKLPESIYHLTKPEKLSLKDCQSIKQLPKSIGNLISLKELSLNNCIRRTT